MTAALCRKRPSPMGSGRQRTWACGIIYLLGQLNNFLSDKATQPHMTMADVCAAFNARSHFRRIFHRHGWARSRRRVRRFRGGVYQRLRRMTKRRTMEERKGFARRIAGWTNSWRTRGRRSNGSPRATARASDHRHDDVACVSLARHCQGEGRLPRGFGLTRLIDLPIAWTDPWEALGLRAPELA
jgi:Domain of unknown function (DUF6398)